MSTDIATSATATLAPSRAPETTRVGLEHADPRPAPAPLAVEAPEPTSPDAQFGVPGVGMATFIGALLGVALILAWTGVFVLVTGDSPALMGAAVHAGLFAGVGFGGMLGAVIQVARHSEHL